MDNIDYQLAHDIRHQYVLNWAEAHNISTEKAYHSKAFRNAWNAYIDYVKTGKQPKGHMREIEKMLGRKLSKSLC